MGAKRNIKAMNVDARLYRNRRPLIPPTKESTAASIAIRISGLPFDATNHLRERTSAALLSLKADSAACHLNKNTKWQAEIVQ